MFGVFWFCEADAEQARAVIPAEAGIQFGGMRLDPGFRRDDDR
jgi:hypothetical protein